MKDGIKITEHTIEIITYTSLGGIGGLIAYLNGIRKGNKFKISMFLINIIISAWVGYVVYDILGEQLGNIKGSIISISGVLSYQIIDFIEEKGFNFLIRRYLGVKK